MTSSGPPPMDLDPKEVLAHLNYLGYHHITGHQLKDFMKDLKKLIRHDQMKSKENTTPTAPMSPCKRKSCQQPSLADHNKQTTNKRSSSTSSTTNLAKSSSTNSSTLTSLNPEQHRPLRPVQPKAPSLFKPSSASSLSAPTFIRPWHMRSSSQIHKAGTSSDPVALYQHYKELWKLNPLPGETNRSELRWKIREKMLGCDPPPRTDDLPDDLVATSTPKRARSMVQSPSCLRDPCNHPPYYIPRYKLDLNLPSCSDGKTYVSNQPECYAKPNSYAKSTANSYGNPSNSHTKKSERSYAKPTANRNPSNSYTKKSGRSYAKNRTNNYAKNTYSSYPKQASSHAGNEKNNQSKKRTKNHSKIKSSVNARYRNFTNPCECLPEDQRLGFHQVKIPLDTSLDQVVNEYARPLAKQMRHDKVYISTKFQSSSWEIQKELRAHNPDVDIPRECGRDPECLL